MDLGLHLALSYRDLKYPTSRQNFAAVVGQNHALILTQCLIALELIALALVALARTSSGADFMGDNIISDDPSDAASTSDKK